MPSLKSLGGRPLRIENSRLYMVLIGAGEALVGSSLFVTVFAHRLTFYASALAGGFAVAGGVYLALAFLSVWNNTMQKPRLAHGLIGNLDLGGSEVLADIDSGTGMVAMEAAERLTHGLSVMTIPKRVKSIHWHDSGTGSDGPKGIVVADPRSLPIRDGALDYATSGFGARHFKGVADRAFVLEEIIRILKPGGSIAVLVRGDPFETSVFFRDKGMVDIESAKAKGFAPRAATVVAARKLFSMDASYELGEQEVHTEPLEQSLVGDGVERPYAPVLIG
jgi:SAM-dependent methyltransferase